MSIKKTDTFYPHDEDDLIYLAERYERIELWEGVSSWTDEDSFIIVGVFRDGGSSVTLHHSFYRPDDMAVQRLLLSAEACTRADVLRGGEV